ncbi:hypothetical protein ACN1C3_28275 [Pseudomonas sp. H11T01]|uniref:hypothetical protein n=1 Tax=Pseudomonas sp. H11T01 TaxID=3402749 RepID=UPI003ACB7774
MDVKDNQVCLCAGELVVFSGGVETQLREDILHSNLAAQLRANKDHPGFSESAEWYAGFMMALGVCGWKVHTQESRSYELEFPGEFSVTGVVEKELTAHLPVTHVVAVLLGLKAVAELPTLRNHTIKTQRLASSETGGPSATRVRLLIALCNHGSTMNVLFLSFETSEVVGLSAVDQLFSTDKLLSSLSVRYCSMELSQRVFARQRDRMTQLLEPHQYLLSTIAPQIREG